MGSRPTRPRPPAQGAAARSALPWPQPSPWPPVQAPPIGWRAQSVDAAPPDRAQAPLRNLPVCQPRPRLRAGHRPPKASAAAPSRAPEQKNAPRRKFLLDGHAKGA